MIKTYQWRTSDKLHHLLHLLHSLCTKTKMGAAPQQQELLRFNAYIRLFILFYLILTMAKQRNQNLPENCAFSLDNVGLKAEYWYPWKWKEILDPVKTFLPYPLSRQREQIKVTPPPPCIGFILRQKNLQNLNSTPNLPIVTWKDLIIRYQIISLYK